ncbi:hypothetical protein A5621_26155 [Mycobacterium colombiense]|uniref:hypothetical protein n=1 Tax=Mycobacterium colombiense TaxID=339268 RepID=UPI0008024CAD|nr:hypothetical protein [Mycobacterium colombiense]OBJ27708.1 hypothetical protein A5621_26155 [Mycobacterium colombiense]
MTIDNPYWDAVKDCVETDSVGGNHAEGGLLDPIAGTGYPDRTLFPSWPPHDQDVGARILLAYNGNRLIYVGDGRGGGTGDQMHQILETQWAEVDSRQPVLWWGQRDRVTAYERGCP